MLISPDRPHPARHMGAVVRVGRPIQSLHQTLLGRDDPDMKIHGDDEPHEHILGVGQHAHPRQEDERPEAVERVAADRKGPFLCKIGAHGFKVGPRADGGQRGRDVPKQRGEDGEGHDEEGESRPESRQWVPRGEKGQSGAHPAGQKPAAEEAGPDEEGRENGNVAAEPNRELVGADGRRLERVAKPLGQRVDEKVFKRAHLYKFS